MDLVKEYTENVERPGYEVNEYPKRREIDSSSILEIWQNFNSAILIFIKPPLSHLIIIPLHTFLGTTFMAYYLDISNIKSFSSLLEFSHH